VGTRAQLRLRMLVCPHLVGVHHVALHRVEAAEPATALVVAAGAHRHVPILQLHALHHLTATSRNPPGADL